MDYNAEWEAYVEATSEGEDLIEMAEYIAIMEAATAIDIYYELG